MDCLRGRPPAGAPYHPAYSRNYLLCFALPWVWVFSPEQQERGVHAIIAETRRIPPKSVDPTAKNFHWADLTRANFEAHDQGAETAILLDLAGFVTEGPGFNVFTVIDGVVASPYRGALEGITRLSVFELCEALGIPTQPGRSHEQRSRAQTRFFSQRRLVESCRLVDWVHAFWAMIAPDRFRPGCAGPIGTSAVKVGTRRQSTTIEKRTSARRRRASSNCLSVNGFA